MRKLPLAALAIAAGLIIAPWTALASPPSTGVIIKNGGSSVYYYANDGRRYVFPNEKTYHSWFLDFTGLVGVTQSEMAAFTLGGNVTYRPGIRMVKIQTDPKVYAVAPGGVLRWVKTESVAKDLYGTNWNQTIDDISDAFFVNYRIGDPIDKASDFSPGEAASESSTIEQDKGLTQSPTARRSDTEVAGLLEQWRVYALSDINELRRQNGKPPLIRNSLLDRIALIHSKDMALSNNFAHTGSLGETPDQRIRDGKVPDLSTHQLSVIAHPTNIDWSGENIGQATMRKKSDTVENTIQHLHRLFMDEPVDQPNHRTTMLSTLHPFSEVGIGPYVDANGDLWLTEDYISR